MYEYSPLQLSKLATPLGPVHAYHLLDLNQVRLSVLSLNYLQEIRFAMYQCIITDVLTPDEQGALTDLK